MTKASLPKSIKSASGLSTAVHERSKRRRDEQAQLARLELPAADRKRNDVSSRLDLKYLPIDSLRPATRRLRKIDAVQAARLDLSVAANGVCQAIVIDDERRIVHGHGVWEAARRAGCTEVPTINVGFLPPHKRDALATTLNRLGETAEWDVGTLKDVMTELILHDEDIIGTGFELAQVDALLLADETSSERQEVLPKVPNDAVSRKGDLWRLGRHLLFNGDALDGGSYGRLFEVDEAARFVFSDVPFNVRIVGHVTSKAHHQEFAAATSIGAVWKSSWLSGVGSASLC